MGSFLRSRRAGDTPRKQNTVIQTTRMMDINNSCLLRLLRRVGRTSFSGPGRLCKTVWHFFLLVGDIDIEVEVRTIDAHSPRDLKLRLGLSRNGKQEVDRERERERAIRE